MGSTPIESTPAGGNSCGAHLSVRSMHLEMRISREGRKVNDLTTPCTGLALWTLNGFNKSTGASAYQWMARFESR